MNRQEMIMETGDRKMARRVTKRTAAEQFLAEVATFMDSPAGEAMALANPKQTLEVIFERAKKLRAMNR